MLAENAGLNATEVISSLYASHASGNVKIGVDIEQGTCKDMTADSVWDLYLTKYAKSCLLLLITLNLSSVNCLY